MGKPKQSAPLAENEHVKELLAILDAHKSPGAADLRVMLRSAARMEEQFAAAVSELAAVRRELNAIREENHPMRKVLQSAVAAMQTHVSKLREQIDTLKEDIIEGCKNTLAAFKERGAAALDGIAKFFKVKPALEAIAKSCDLAAKDNAKRIDTIERVSREYHKAGRHLRNIGRAFAGKELIAAAKRPGRAARAAEAPLKAVRACNLAMRDAARDAAKSLSRLEKAADKLPPVREQFGAAAKKAAAHNNAKNARDRTKPAPAAEL
jgi:hypothetical protein